MFTLLPLIILFMNFLGDFTRGIPSGCSQCNLLQDLGCNLLHTDQPLDSICPLHMYTQLKN